MQQRGAALCLRLWLCLEVLPGERGDFASSRVPATPPTPCGAGRERGALAGAAVELQRRGARRGGGAGTGTARPRGVRTRSGPHRRGPPIAPRRPSGRDSPWILRFLRFFFPERLRGTSGRPRRVPEPRAPAGPVHKRRGDRPSRPLHRSGTSGVPAPLPERARAGVTRGTDRTPQAAAQNLSRFGGPDAQGTGLTAGIRGCTGTRGRFTHPLQGTPGRARGLEGVEGERGAAARSSPGKGCSEQGAPPMRAAGGGWRVHVRANAGLHEGGCR